MLPIEASTPNLTGNSSILPDIAEDLQPNKYTNNYTSPSENLLKTNEISSPNTTIEPLASNNQILDNSPETPPQPDIDTFILNKNPTPTTNNIPEKPQISTTQTDPITGDTAKPATQNNISFDSGIFQADQTGKISFDYLSDGGLYQGELAIISLTGMQEFIPDSEAFIKEAARRALSNSSLGYIAISDSTEAAKFSSFEEENNFNIGEYRGIKTFAMTPGDELGIILVPNGTIQQVYDNPGMGGDKKPLFSMATANSSGAFKPGQIASVANGSSIFVMEDMGIGEGSDADYNDIIFSLKGASPKVISMDDVIAKNSDWRTSEKGKELIGDAAPQTESKLEDKKADTTPATNPVETKPENSPATETKNPTVSENPNSGTNPAETKTENTSATETENQTISEIPNSPTNPVETKTENSSATETENPTVSEIPNSRTNPVETKTENSSATETENPTVSEIPNSPTNPVETKTENSSATETENPTVSEIPNSPTNPVETKTENSPATETENQTVSEIPNSPTNPVETKTENSSAGETQNPTISENIISSISENTQPAIVNINSIDFITGDKIEIPVFIQADKPEIPEIPAESTDILTTEIENISPNPIDSAEIASQTPENFPLSSPEEISQLSETLNSIFAQQFPLIPSTELGQNHQPSASEYLVTDAQTIIPEIAVTQNHHSQQSENITADSDNQQPTTIDEYVNPDFDSQNIAITPEIPSEENNQPDNSQNIIADSFIATATDSDSETTINEYTVTDTETKPETTPNLPQQNQPLIGIIDTGFVANNPNIDYSQIILGKDLIEGDNNPLLQPNQENQHGDTILEIISHSNNQNNTKKSTPIWLGRATGSGNWHQSLIEFVDAAKASKQPNAVVNLSFDLTQINPDGTQTTRHKLTAEEKSALKYAQDNNILIVAAAGNQGELASALGQASTEFDNIITVGASENNHRSAYSSYGEGLDILAQISSPQTAEPSTTETKQGTSIAAAKVTNTLSQMWAANPSLSRQQIKNILLKTASDIDVPGWDERTGYGILNPELAIATATETIPAIPVLAATKHLTKSLIAADANTSNSANHTAAKPSERPALTNASSSTPKTTSTSTGDSDQGTSSSTTELAPNTTTATSNSDGTTTTNTHTQSFFSNIESSWDKSTVTTNSKGNSFEENTIDSSTNAATYTSTNFSQNSVENTNQSQEKYSRVKYEGTRNDKSSSNQKSRNSSNYTTPSQTTKTTGESYRNSKSQSESKYATGDATSNSKRQEDWGSQSTSNTSSTSSTGRSVNNSSTQVKGKADWTNSSKNSSYTNTHKGEQSEVNRSNSESSSSSGFYKYGNSSDNSSVINSTWENTTTDGKAVGSNSRDIYSEAKSNANSSYDDGKSKNTSNTDTYTLNQSQETNSRNGSNYEINNAGNNYSVTQSNETQNYKNGPSTSSHNRDTYSVSKSNSSSSNSSGKVSSKNQQENYSENHAEWESEYKADTYTTQSKSDESTITASKSNSSTEGSNSTSSNSSDTSKTQNSQTVTTHQDGRKTESGSSSYEKWSSEGSSDSNGLVSSVSKYSKWSSSYSKSYFKGGYSWTETVSGYDSESVTKGGVSTSKGSSWSWTRSATVWDDGRNSWSESWSESNWENGKSAPTESESKTGGFDPEKTGPQVNDVPKFGEAPRLNKGPKQEVPIDFQKPPKPSDDIWWLPSFIIKESSQFKEVFASSGSDKPDIADNFSGDFFAGGGAPPQPTFKEKIEKLLRTGAIANYNLIVDLIIQQKSLEALRSVVGDVPMRTLIVDKFSQKPEMATAIMAALLKGSQWWDNPTKNDFTDHFLRNNSDSPISYTATMNCWEMIWYAAFLCGKMTAARIRSAMERSNYKTPVFSAMQPVMGYQDGLPFYPGRGVPGKPTRSPLPGELVFFKKPKWGDNFFEGDADHVAIALTPTKIVSLWNQPNNNWTIQIIDVSQLPGYVQVGKSLDFFKDILW